MPSWRVSLRTDDAVFAFSTDQHMTRDPTLDPQPGDIVKSTTFKNERERHVMARRGEFVDYTAISPTNLTPRTCWITAWQDWCRANKVLVTTSK